MSQIKTSRRVRSFRRSMAILLLIALAALGYLYWQSRQEKLPVVRVATVQRQDISAGGVEGVGQLVQRAGPVPDLGRPGPTFFPRRG